MARNWKPSKAAAKEFLDKMKEIEVFCSENGINASLSNDSYYFVIGGTKYRVSNHSVEVSNAGAYDVVTGENRREKYHEGGRENDTIYIHAGKSRIIEIYNNLAAGIKLDGRGNVTK